VLYRFLLAAEFLKNRHLSFIYVFIEIHSCSQIECHMGMLTRNLVNYRRGEEDIKERLKAKDRDLPESECVYNLTGVAENLISVARQQCPLSLNQ
jgi:hypothetical protein